MQKKRVSIFIDGSNFYHSTVKKGIKIDFQKLIQKLVGDRELINAFYYIAPLDIKIDRKKYWKHQKFLNLLEKIPNFKIVLCTLKKLKADNGKGYIYLVKGDDVRLAQDILMGAVRDLYDVAIIVSGDEDFLPLFKTIKEYEKKIENAYFNSSSSYNLRKACDKSVNLNRIFSEIIFKKK